MHRIGRTGRLGNVGIYISFFDPVSDAPYAGFYVQVGVLELFHPQPELLMTYTVYVQKLEEVGQEVPYFLSHFANGTEVGMRLQFDPYAKFWACEKYKSDLYPTGGEGSTVVREGVRRG